MNTDQYTCITEEGKKNYAENEINLIKERLNFFFEALLEKKLSDDYLLVVGHPNSEEVKNILNNFRNKIIIVIADEQKSIKYLANKNLNTLFFYRPINSSNNNTDHIKSEIRKIKKIV